jgi:genome maintenance exonuclease 1|tara:strand:- start:68 stop:763 length:696 start_codon:yes stop_codon:yes gene_type:complete
MKKNTKYSYTPGQRFEVHGSRQYDFGDGRLPSVTTILSRTKDQGYLDRWKAKVGHDEAERIKNHSSKRGTSMHKFIENHITGVGYDDLSNIGNEARPMAQKIIELGLSNITEYYGSEVALYYPDLYAGATDLVCLHNGVEAIIDFKQANRPKKEEWIEDYFIQIAAYAMAHNYMFPGRSKVEKGVIMICTPDLYYQEFIIEGSKLQHYYWKFLERLSQYLDQNKAEIRQKV